MRHAEGENLTVAIPKTAMAVAFVRILAVLSLLALIVPNVALLTGRFTALAVEVRTPLGRWQWLAVALAITASYVFYMLRIWPAPTSSVAATLLAAMIALALLGEALTPLPLASELWLYAAVVAGCALLPRWALVAVVAMTVVAGAAVLRLQPGVGPPPSGSMPSAGGVLDFHLGLGVQSGAPVLMCGLGAMLATLLVRTNAELHTARAALARLAVDEERTRVARDLHDLLGHNLSFLAVKLELARRLVGEPEHPAATELADAHRIAREALRDVREVVGGYRQPTLEGELAGARVALEAAGIDVALHDAHGVLTSEVEAACAWVVREGVTNVIEHSNARSCRIDIRRNAGCLVASITDDGGGSAGNGGGMGLEGLHERVAALGGTLIASPAPSRTGFLLLARIPDRTGETGGGAD